MSNIFSDIPDSLPEELFEKLAGNDQVTIERIVSKGHATPEGEWLCEPCNEWVVVLQGEAVLAFEGANSRRLAVGDCLLIPANIRHRVEWTAEGSDTVWLAVHFPP